MSFMSTDKLSSKKKYEKPVLRSFPLIAEEVMASGCKTSSTPPGVTPSGQTSCTSLPCSDAGS